MKRTILFSAFAVFLAFALPPLLSVPSASAAPTESDKPATATLESPAPTDALPAQLLADAAIPIALMTDAGIEEISMAEYLPLALAAEMPASFAPDALKAQAVALRSYALHWQAQRKSAHPDADVCASSACCTARTDLQSLRESWGADFEAYYEKICAAVRETDGQYLVWESAPALTVFHAASAGATEFGAALGMDKAYLVSVSTPELSSTVRNLITTVEVSPDDFRTSILSLCPDAALAGANAAHPLRARGEHGHRRANAQRPCAAPAVFPALHGFHADAAGRLLHFLRARLRSRTGHEPVWGKSDGAIRRGLWRNPAMLLSRHRACGCHAPWIIGKKR